MFFVKGSEVGLDADEVKVVFTHQAPKGTLCQLLNAKTGGVIVEGRSRVHPSDRGKYDRNKGRQLALGHALEKLWSTVEGIEEKLGYSPTQNRFPSLMDLPLDMRVTEQQVRKEATENRAKRNVFWRGYFHKLNGDKQRGIAQRELAKAGVR